MNELKVVDANCFVITTGFASPKDAKGVVVTFMPGDHFSDFYDRENFMANRLDEVRPWWRKEFVFKVKLINQVFHKGHEVAFANEEGAEKVEYIWVPQFDCVIYSFHRFVGDIVGTINPLFPEIIGRIVSINEPDFWLENNTYKYREFENLFPNLKNGNIYEVKPLDGHRYINYNGIPQEKLEGNETVFLPSDAISPSVLINAPEENQIKYIKKICEQVREKE